MLAVRQINRLHHLIDALHPWRKNANICWSPCLTDTTKKLECS
jgi:hypothetical protein